MENSDHLKGRDIIVVGQQPWDVSIGSNCKNIAIEWSKYNRVLYVNSPLDRISKFRGKSDPKITKRISVVEGREKGLIPIKENLWNLFPDEMIESINWIKWPFFFEFFNKRNNKLFSTSILKAVKELGFKDFILFNDNDMFRSFYLKTLLKPAISIYYSRDFMLAVEYWSFHGKKHEPELIADSDICVANSTYLADYCRKYNNNSFYVGQGCELDIFMQTDGLAKPNDLLPIKGPVIGYVGALQSIRLDISILEYIAASKPEWAVVLVGPEDNEFMASALHQMNNVYFLGSKDPSTLPAYINAFDVCINPQIVNQVTIGNYPRKIDEYLAVGKPVVATKTEAMSIFKDHCYLAETKDDYVWMIAESLQNNSPELKAERRNFASAHTWENSVLEIDKAISNWFDATHQTISSK
jgi:glycosyltransferase involved in cell wall biosynthesis